MDRGSNSALRCNTEAGRDRLHAANLVAIAPLQVDVEKQSMSEPAVRDRGFVALESVTPTSSHTRSTAARCISSLTSM
jgi:hypothetical protein